MITVYQYLWLLAHLLPHSAPDAPLHAILCFSEPTASVPPQSDVYRMLHDNRDEPTQPRQSGSFRVLQELVNDGPGEQPLLPVTGGPGVCVGVGRGRGQQTYWE